MYIKHTAPYFWHVLNQLTGEAVRGYLYDALPRRRGRAVEEAVVVRVSLGEPQPFGQVGGVLQVALEHHGVIVQDAS